MRQVVRYLEMEVVSSTPVVYNRKEDGGMGEGHVKV